MKNKTRLIGHADFHILLALFDADRHGYGIMKEVTRITDAALNLGPGTLYGAIRRLLAAGLIKESDTRPTAEQDDERRRCYYKLTSAGRKVSVEECRRVANLMRAAEDKGALTLDPTRATQGGR